MKTLSLIFLLFLTSVVNADQGMYFLAENAKGVFEECKWNQVKYEADGKGNIIQTGFGQTIIHRTPYLIHLSDNQYFKVIPGTWSYAPYFAPYYPNVQRSCGQLTTFGQRAYWVFVHNAKEYIEELR